MASADGQRKRRINKIFFFVRRTVSVAKEP